MVIFDAHCDTLQKLCDFGGSLAGNTYHIDLGALNNISGYVQFFAAFIDKRNDKKSPFLRCRQLIDCYFREINKYSESISHCEDYFDIQAALKSQKVAALLSIEGGEAIEGSIDKLKYFYKQGVRAMTLCWNYDNEICGGIENNNKGLSSFGKEVVLEMNALGMLIDVSHCSENTFWDVIEESSEPVCATHSNARAVCAHKRNLTDTQILAIIKKGGCIGINLYPTFVKGESCCVKDVIMHIEHILALGGENNIGLGCDFDGVDRLPKEMDGAKDLHKLFDEMHRVGYTELLIKKLSSLNFLSLMEKII